jgi:hypothetical protein
MSTDQTDDKPVARPAKPVTEPAWALHDAITADPAHRRDYRTAKQPTAKRTTR